MIFWMWDTTPKSQATHTHTKRVSWLHETKKFLYHKRNDQHKRQPTECQKNSCNHISAHELLYTIYNQLIQLNSKTTTQIIQIFKNRERTKLIQKDNRIVIVRTGNCGKVILDAATAAKSLQSCPTLCSPIDSSPPDEGEQKAQASSRKINKC